jgi:hypothetical protein
VKFLMSNFIANYDNLELQFHEESIFMRHVYNSSRHEMRLSGKKHEKQQLIIKDADL